VDAPIAQRCQLLNAVHLDKENLDLRKILADARRQRGSTAAENAAMLGRRSVARASREPPPARVEAPQRRR
jgi:hypothetical protein